MQSGATLLRQHRRTIALIIGCVILLALIIGVIAVTYAGTAKRAELRINAGETLAVQAQALGGLMEKFRLLPNLISRYSPVRQTFEAGAGGDKTHQLLQQVSALSGALDVALLSADGALLVTARDVITKALPARSQLLQVVAQGRLGREVRPFGTRGRAYVFAHGARNDQGDLIGVVAVLFDLGTLEQVWSLTNNPVFVSDASGTILVTNREQWRMQPAADLFGGESAPLGFVDYARALPQLGWTLHVLADADPIEEAQTQAAITVAILAMALAASLIAFANRHLANQQRHRKERATALRLERLVRDRTSDLTRTNSALADEVNQHKKTEAILRQTQAELIQTGKLAALGQMSTALSHEYSQPLAATKSYADNAIQFLDRKRTDEARQNLTLISQMADRMAAISKHLRNFARKPNIAFGAVPIGTVTDDALAVLAARIRETGAGISVSGNTDGVWVRGGQVRLQQVLVNLVANALDVSQNVEIETETSTEKVRVHVRDFGPGVAQDVADKIFDPFFTTKGPGDGLGLGLSISFNIVKDFGGRLTCENLDNGAQFTVELLRGEAQIKAAE